MAVEREIWEGDIVEKLYAENPHLSLCVNADQYVLAGKVVHIPQAGAAPDVVKNRSSLPAAVKKRTDTDITYPLDEYTSDPVHISNAETIEPSYDKRMSVMADTHMALNETVGVVTIRNWAPSGSARIIRTSGEAVAAHMPGATGMRKKFLKAELKKAQKQMNKDNIPTSDRYAMFDADMMDQLTDSLTDSEYRDFSRAYDEKNGVVGKLFGFTILSRSYVLGYNGSAAIEPGGEGNSPDCAAVLCWHKNSVENALGQVKFFEDEGNPQYYGDIYSALVRMGGRIRREDQKGVVAIVQDLVTEAWKTGEEYKKSMYDCATLAGLLGVKKIVAMAGLPAGSETDTTPNWITSTVSWPDFMAPAYEYQWKVTIEFWNEFIAHCKKCGIEHIAIEEFPGTMVWSASTLLKLREATDPMLGINLDPSHMMGYDGDVSLEMEDLTMTVDAGVNTSIDALRQTISQ